MPHEDVTRQDRPASSLDALSAWRRHRPSRRDRIVEEIQRNRRGEYVVPTWVLAVALVAMVGGLALLVIFSQ